eukprot:COSAG01_NODE_38878_length_484_cov_0.612987_2_plen_100_part_01
MKTNTSDKMGAAPVGQLMTSTVRDSDDCSTHSLPAREEDGSACCASYGGDYGCRVTAELTPLDSLSNVSDLSELSDPGEASNHSPTPPSPRDCGGRISTR